MKKIILITAIFAAFTFNSFCQSQEPVNQTDAQGRKQGHWIRKYNHGAVMYDGYFSDDHPVGEFRRYFEDNNLMSVLVYNDDGTEADAKIYHPNGFLASAGKYKNQLKEGKWKFYSSETEGWLINEEDYSKNIRNGLSVKYYPDGSVAEKITYINGMKEGEWLKYHPGGRLLLRSFYKNNMLNGSLDAWFENGQVQFSGTYRNNKREGTWLIYNMDGTLRYRMEYVNGITNDKQMEIDQTEYLEMLEKNAGKIPDPEKTGEIR